MQAAANELLTAGDFDPGQKFDIHFVDLGACDYTQGINPKKQIHLEKPGGHAESNAGSMA